MTFWMYRLRKKNIENIAAGHQHHRHEARRAGLVGEDAERQQRVLDPALDEDEEHQQDDAAARLGDGPGVAPAVVAVAGAGQAVDEGEQAAGAGDGAGDVELAGVALGLVEEARGEHRRHEADRDVDQEGQPPAVDVDAGRSRCEPVSQPPRIRPTAAPAPDIAA